MAILTPERQAAQTQYFAALGQFMQQCADVEGLFLEMLIAYSGVSRLVGEAIFSGTRMDTGIGLLKRLIEIKPPSKKQADDLKYILPQIKAINDARNLIAHYGADIWEVDSGPTKVSTKRVSMGGLRLREHPISTRVIQQMSIDLLKITFHIVARHTLPKKHVKKDKVALKRGIVQQANASWGEAFERPWLYIPPPQPNPPKADRQKHKKRPQSRSSQR